MPGTIGGGSKAMMTVPVDADLLRRLRAAGRDVDGVAERAVAQALRDIDREREREDVAHDLAMVDAYVQDHGDPVSMLRDFLETRRGSDDGAV